jgi:phosphatidylcholine synthase
VLTFAPFHVVHPVRVVRLRRVTLALMSLWGLLAIYVVVRDFDVGATVTFLLCAIGLYIVASDAAIRLLRSLKA